jgi:hypothetical protein
VKLTWFITERRISPSGALLAIPPPHHFDTRFFVFNMPVLTQESRIIMAMEAVEGGGCSD